MKHEQEGTPKAFLETEIHSKEEIQMRPGMKQQRQQKVTQGGN